MDLTSTVRSDALPAVGSMLVPGALAAAPYVALAWGPPHNLKLFIDANQGISTAAAALLVVSVGLVVESFGSYAEYFAVDRCHRDQKAMLAEWKRYLQIAWETEPIGQHYLRKVLTIFKFELNLCVAAVLTLPGSIALAYYAVLPSHAMWAILVGTLVLVGVLFKVAVDSSILLANLRHELVAQAIRVKLLASEPDAA